MNNALTNFVFDAQDGTPRAVRTLMRDGEPWFVAADVLNVLKLDRKALERLDDDEKGVNSIHTLGGIQEMVVVNEPGLYSLILGSRKPEAKAFKKWVTAEVLPSIRKTGAYVDPAAPLGHAAAPPVQFLSHGADILVAADRTFRSALRSARSAGLPLPRALRRANEICMTRTGLDMLTELDAHDQLTPPTSTVTQTTPGHLQAQVADFAAALLAGHVPGAQLPMLTTQLYRFYTWWCRANQVPPASQVRFSALMVQGGVFHARRKRYTNQAGEAVGPMAIAMPMGQSAPVHQHGSDWLGQHILRAARALADLNA